MVFGWAALIALDRSATESVEAAAIKAAVACFQVLQEKIGRWQTKLRLQQVDQQLG